MIDHRAELAPPPDQADRHRIRTDLATNLFVEAGAGAGKTTNLVDRIVAVVRSGVDIGAVAAITLPNEPSVALHERLGFELVGVFRDVGRKFDEWHDVGFWQLRLE